MTNTVKFATFGPNRGLSFSIGNHKFVDGICEVPEQAASSASSILTRYYDVCYEHELEQKIAEYDAIYAKPETYPVGNLPPAVPKTPEKDPEITQNPESGQSPSAQSATQNEPPASDAANTGDADTEKKAANGKKQNGKS